MLFIFISYLIEKDIKEINFILKIIYLIELSLIKITGNSLFNLYWFIEEKNLECNEILLFISKINRHVDSKLSRIITLLIDIILNTKDYEDKGENL